MKKTLLAAVVAACATISGAALADDGQVKFIGDIIDAGCDVVNDLSNPAGSPNGTDRQDGVYRYRFYCG